ncbi:hypothetical protein PFICI_07506 [Pestalotiopsis fici W106-1]|uniref:Major facilitator superfamily (MFS) profile domain-containing protein n=1 Tax=Pestalotiopsis fici (strain W106-1 / CGMCC3.15140) TaxID=1229662 RepID=W3X3J6_PESFW|nr:uncharacterized protein PFICI_07506 [Pestalotiopsis fici W106-1]ETS79977.1 hypothetical protein PFICI_07506 [Pestalotiopsis fici W106-1]
MVFSTLRRVVWGKAADTKIERKLLVKLDAVILPFCCLMYWVNYLDRMNLNNAYVSGMKEDLNFQGNQLNVINTIFYAGYVIGQIPNNLALQRLPPRFYFPSCMIAWGLLTLGTGFAHHPWEIMVLRFFQAIFESSTFVGCHYILGSWYKEEELGKRTAIFTSSGLAGTMFSGFLQGGIHQSLDGAQGLPGWRWLFVIDFCITIPVAIFGFFAFPDTPESTKARWLTDEEKKVAIERLPTIEKHRGVLGWSLISRVLATWHWWVNYIPTGVAAVGIVATLFLGWYSDFTKRSWHVGIMLALTAIISGAIMLNPPSRGAKFFTLFLNRCQYASQTVFFAWANGVTRKDDAKRAINLGGMNTFAIAVYMFWSIVFYSTTQGPDWSEGSIAMICIGSALFLTTLFVFGLERRDGQMIAVYDGVAAESYTSGEEDKGHNEDTITVTKALKGRKIFKGMPGLQSYRAIPCNLPG